MVCVFGALVVRTPLAFMGYVRSCVRGVQRAHVSLCRWRMVPRVTMAPYWATCVDRFIPAPASNAYTDALRSTAWRVQSLVVLVVA